MKVIKPIIVVSTGRSGSTMFHDIITRHESIAWFSVLLSKFPTKIKWNRYYMSCLDIPIIGTILRKKIIPSESYPFWETHIKGFRRPFRDLRADDVSVKIKKKIPSLFSKTLTKKRHRLLIKLTGWSRIAFLNEIFPDAMFIHIKRNLRPTVNSFLNVDFWNGWEGPQKWRFGELNIEEEAQWNRYDQSFAALASIGVIKMIKSVHEAKKTIPENRFLEVSYEDICDDPIRTFKKIYEFAGLKESKRISRDLKTRKLVNKDNLWMEELNDIQIKTINEILGPYLYNK
jgi:hypothetical protein